MPRSSVPLTRLYFDELRLWQAVHNAGSARLELDTPASAIGFVIRLQKCRAAFRDEPYNNHVWDSYAVNRSNNVIVIEPKQRLDLSKATDLYGNPISIPDHPSDDKG